MILELLGRAYLGNLQVTAVPGGFHVEASWDAELLQELREKLQDLGLNFDTILRETMQQIAWSYQAEKDQNNGP